MYEPKKERVLEQCPGMHGEVGVVENHRMRKLTVNGFNQSEAFHTPSSTDIYEGAVPGPGLVEIDPEVIRLARSYFPLVSYFEERDRLAIHEGDAVEFCRQQREFDFLVCDLFQGVETVSLDAEEIQIINRISPALWVNLTGRLDQPGLRETLHKFRKAGAPFSSLSSLVPPEWRINANWIATNETVDTKKVSELIPYKELDGADIKQIRTDYKSLTSRFWNMTEIDSFSGR